MNVVLLDSFTDVGVEERRLRDEVVERARALCRDPGSLTLWGHLDAAVQDLEECLERKTDGANLC